MPVAIPSFLTAILLLIVLVAAVWHSAVFSGLETGIYALNKVRLDLQAQKGKKTALRLQALLTKPNKLLATILIGVNISGYAASFAISSLFILIGAGIWSGWLTLTVATPLLFIAGESVPKSVYRRMTEKLTYQRAWVLSSAVIIFNVIGIGPLVRGFAAVLTKIIFRNKNISVFCPAGISAALVEGQASGVLTRSQLAMADRVMLLPEVTVESAMVPMDEVIWAYRNISREELTELFAAGSISRIPLFSASGKVAGILDMYRVISGSASCKPSAFMRDVMFLPENTSIADALLCMRRANVVMAMVQKSSDCIGIITLKDLVEEIVGEIEAW